ncbi:hypothetical protein Tco_1212741 [Tanacetum coccineum]
MECTWHNRRASTKLCPYVHSSGIRGALIIEDWVSDSDEDETVVLESLNVQKPKQADQPRKINMLVDKKYPLKKEILKKMINLKIEAEEESDIHLSFISLSNLRCRAELE